ncbi:MAG: hypothetical protein LBS79_02680 [Tannerella sp.]|jgi:hypothetical protein|nr:hypothetical protein [Tannerella sp.]
MSGLWLALIYLPVVGGVFAFIKKNLKFPQTAKILYFTGCISILAINILLLHFIDYQQINVDRASGLQNWNEYLLRGINPYLSLSHMGNHFSVFPVWALLHLPFSILGNMGYSQVFFLVVLFAVLFFYFKSNGLLYISLMMMSPAFWYQCVVRNDLWSNLFVTLIFIILLSRYQIRWQKHKLITAFITGLLMCTRIFVIIPLFLFFFRYWLDFSRRDKIYFVLLCLTGFIVPFIPFIVWDYEPLIASWHLQTTVHGTGNVWVALACLILTVGAALKLKTERLLFFWSGFILFAVTFLVSVETIIHEGFELFLSKDLYDIAYYSVCFPFLLYFSSTDK